MSEQKVMNRWLVVIGAVLVQMCLGAIYAWSVFTPALGEAGWTASQTQQVFSAGLLFYALSMVWAGGKLEAYGPRKLAILGGAILGCGYIIAGLFAGTNFWMLLFFIGVVGGTGIGVGYVVPIAVGMRWFPDKKGLITGLAVAGFGLGAMFWVKLAGSMGHFIENFGLSTTFVIFGVAFAVLVTIGGMFMVFPPEGWLPEGYSPESSESGASATREFTSSEMLRTPQFWMIFFTFVFLAGAGLMCIGLMKLYPMQALMAGGLTQAKASAVAGTAMAVYFSIANAAGRVMWGTISDKLGRKLSLTLLAASQGVIVFCFTFMAGTPSLLYLGAALIGFNFGGGLSLFPTLTADTFGAENVGKNYPFVFLAYGAGGLLGPNLGGKLGNMGNFPLAFSICGVCCIIGAVLVILLRPPKAAEAPVNAEPA